MNVKDDVVDESVPVAARHGDESDQILELSSAASAHQHSPTSEDSSAFQSATKPLKTGDSPEDEQEQQEQPEDEDPAKRRSSKTDSAASAKAKRPPKKKGVWKKPPGMPKRPLSAYNLFFRQTRMQLLGDEVSQEFQITDQSKRRHRTSHGKIGFKELATQIGSNWKNLQGPERKVYEDQARLEKLRYKKELEEWKKAGGSSKPPPLASSSPPHPPSSSVASLPSSATTPGGGGTGGEEKDDSPSTMMTTDSSTERQQQHVGTESPSKKEAADALAGLSDEVSAAIGPHPPAMLRSVTHPPRGSAAAAAAAASSFHQRGSVGSFPPGFGSPSTLRSPVAGLLHDPLLMEQQGRGGFPRLPLGGEDTPFGSIGALGSLVAIHRPYSGAAAAAGGASGSDPDQERRHQMIQRYERHLAEAQLIREELERSGGSSAMQEQRGGLSSSMRSYWSTDPSQPIDNRNAAIPLSVSTRTAPAMSPSAPTAMAPSTAAAAAAVSQDLPRWSSMVGGPSGSSLGSSGYESMFHSPTSQLQHQQPQQQVGLGTHGAMGFAQQQQHHQQQQQQQQLQHQQQQQQQEQQYRAQQQHHLLQLRQSQQVQQQRLQELSVRQQQLGNSSQQQQQQQQRLSLLLYGTTAPGGGGVGGGGGSVGGSMDLNARAQRMQMLEEELQAERARHLEDEIRMFLHRRQGGGGGPGGGGV